jgi:hypothetical protein
MLYQNIKHLNAICEGILKTKYAFIEHYAQVQHEFVTYVFNIKYSNEIISGIEIVVHPSDNSMNINAIYTAESHRNQGFATLLIIYAITHIKNITPKIKSVTLDDMSDKSCWMENNIFNQLGFQFIEPPSQQDPMDTNEWMLKGPEKILQIDANFIQLGLQRAYQIVNK